MMKSERTDVIRKRREGRILVVDDHKDFAFNLVDILESRGYQVEVAHSAQSGREKAATFRAQVVLLDIRLGRESGIDLITQLQEARPEILCVMMTAYAAVDTAVEAIHRGAYDYLQKPLNMQYLLAALDRCFERLRLESEKSATEEALRESEASLKQAQRLAHVGSWEWDLEDDVFRISEEMRRIYGLSEDDRLHDARSFMEATVHPEDLGKIHKAVRERISTPVKAPTGKPSKTVTYRIVRPDGQLRWLTMPPPEIRAVSEGGKPAVLIGTVQDITERVQAEEAMKRRNRELALLNRAGRELAATLDLQRVAEQLLQEVTETIGAEGASIWLRDEEREGGLVCQAALASGRHRSLVNLRLRPGQGIAGWVVQTGRSVVAPDASGDPRFFSGIDAQTGFDTASLLAVPLRARGAVIGVLEVVNKLDGDFGAADLALVEALATSAAIAIDNARLVEALRERTAELQARNEELDAYAHTVAHDLKGPLGPIVGFAQVLREDYATLPEEEVRRYLHTIAQNGRKMSSIIDELLLLAVLRDVGLEEMRPLDMASIVDEVLERMAYVIERYQAEIVLPDAWPVALGYGPWVEEVWGNYLSNALKYGGRPEEGIPPRVELGFDEPANQRIGETELPKVSPIRFWMRDNGPGLTREEQARLFTPFTRLDPRSGKGRARGHGLGLSIVRRIVEKMGGQVGVESSAPVLPSAVLGAGRAGEIGAGSAFWFTLPAQRG